jgi:hypothetical protein
MRKEARFLTTILFTISAAMYTAVFLQQTDGASNDKAIQCKYLISDISKCSQKDRPFILPFP